MKQGEPRFCAACGINRRAISKGTFCFDCMPGGPFTPPPCTRCGTTENFFASGLCARCHLYGTIRVDSCPDCHAWGTTRHGGWICRGCSNYRLIHPAVGPCAICRTTVAVNNRQVCRLCWRTATGTKTSRGDFDPVGGNRHGQQLFFADMHKAAKYRRHPKPTKTPVCWDGRWPVRHRQLALFTLPRKFTHGRHGLLEPPSPELAAALDNVAVDYGRKLGWDRTRISEVRSGIRIMLGTQATPGARISYSEMADLPRLYIGIRPIIEVLETIDMFEDDRAPTIDRWFADRIIGLPAAMADELNTWLDVMHHGSTTPPRRRPRSPITIRIYTGIALPALQHWAADGHQSLREITRSQVLAGLPREPGPRKIAGQAMRSIFGTLKDRKLIFANPAVRLAHTSETPIPPPAVDLDAVRDALNSPDPSRAAICALVAFHGLASHQIRELRLTDIRDRRLHLDGRVIPIAEPARRRIRTWLDHRNQRWPTSPNPHLFIHFRSAANTEPVGTRWVFLTLGITGGAQALRADRILNEAVATGGDPRRLCDLFGLSIGHATRYTQAITEPPPLN